MRFLINKCFQFGLCFALSSAAWATLIPVPWDPVYVQSGGCVKSPLPYAPKAAVTFTSTVEGVQVSLWFEPCTMPGTKPGQVALLMQVSGNRFPDTTDYFYIVENSRKFELAFYTNEGSAHVMAPNLETQTFLVTKVGAGTTFKMDPSLVKLGPTGWDFYDSEGVIDVLTHPLRSIPIASGLDSPIPLTNYTGPWWNTKEGGHGLVISQDSANYLWLTWYSYDDQSEPLWYVSASSNNWTSATQIEGDLLRTRYSGSNALTGAFDAKQVTQEKVGTFSLTFKGASYAYFSYTMNGKTITKEIVRFKLH